MPDSPVGQSERSAISELTGVWYCPVCGYVDPGTRDVHCPKRHADGLKRPMFREAHRGYYIRVGIEEGERRLPMRRTETSGEEKLARVWWELLRACTGGGTPWEEASEDAKQATIDYIRSTA